VNDDGVPAVCGRALPSRRMIPNLVNATRNRKINCVKSVTLSNPIFKSGNSLAMFRLRAQESHNTAVRISLHIASSTFKFRPQATQRRHLACHRRLGMLPGGAYLTQGSSIVAEHSTQTSEVGWIDGSAWDISSCGRLPNVSRKMLNAVGSW